MSALFLLRVLYCDRYFPPDVAVTSGTWPFFNWLCESRLTCTEDLLNNPEPWLRLTASDKQQGGSSWYALSCLPVDMGSSCWQKEEVLFLFSEEETSHVIEMRGNMEWCLTWCASAGGCRIEHVQSESCLHPIISQHLIGPLWEVYEDAAGSDITAGTTHAWFVLFF